MTQAQSTTTDLTQEMQTYYDRVFLERAEYEQKYNFLAVKKNVPVNSGKVVYFTRQTAFTPKTAALTEGTTPTGTEFSASTASATLAEYGDTDQISSLFELTSIDKGLKEKVETMGQYAGESMDTVLRNTIFSGATDQFAGSNTLLTAVNTSDTMSVSELRKAVLTLKTNKAPKWKGGLYRGVISSHGVYNLQGDSTTGNWTDVNIYNTGENAEMVKKGVIGVIAGVAVVESNNEYTQASTTTVYSNFVAGRGAIGEVDIAGKGNSRTIYKRPGPNDTGNPLDMYSTLSWKVDSYAALVLNSDWVIDIQCGYE